MTIQVVGEQHPPQRGVIQRDFRKLQAQNLAMPIGFRPPIPNAADWQAQKFAIRLCRGAACYAALTAHFGTRNQTRLEWTIDGRRPYGADNDDVDQSSSNKYLRWGQGKTLPSNSSVDLVYEHSGGAVRLNFWRDLPLWELLQPQPPSLQRLHAILEASPPGVRRILFIDVEPGEGGRYSHTRLRRSELLALRNLRSLDAFTALLCLARKGELLEDDQYQYLPSACAYDMLPRLLYSHPPLRCQWEMLFSCLERIFWRRVYVSGDYFEFPIETVRSSIETLDKDSSAPLPQKSGKRIRVIDDDPITTLEKKFERAKLWEREHVKGPRSHKRGRGHE